MGFSSHDDFTQPVRFRSRCTNEFLKKALTEKAWEDAVQNYATLTYNVNLDISQFSTSNERFLSFFFWTWERTAASGFHCHDNETNFSYSFYRRASYKSWKCFSRNNTIIHASWKRRRIQFVGCQESWRASFDWQGEMISTSLINFTTSILWGESLRKSARNLHC